MKFCLLMLTSLGLIGCSSESNYQSETNYQAGKFYNPEQQPNDVGPFGAINSIYFNGSDYPLPSEPLPVKPVLLNIMESSAEPSLVKLGHSSVLLRLDEQYILFDPMFSERASPVSWAGPKRFTPPAITIDALPKLDAIVISHNHFDHLDEHTIKALIERTDHYYVPLGVKALMIDWGVPEEKVTELGWWQEAQLGQSLIAATPSQHFSGRSLTDKNETLWVSWVIAHDDLRLFFSGDSGYFSGFKAIGDKYGPFDVTLMENGAYNSLWQFVHLFPKETVQAHLDLKGHYLVPIHNATFNLSNHAWFEPLEKIEQEAQQHQVELITPIFGDVITLSSMDNFKQRWWKAYLPSSLAVQ